MTPRLRSGRTSRVRAVLAGAVVLALSTPLVACSTANTAGGGSGEGGTLTFGALAAPPTLNPATGDPAYNPLYQWAYEPLVVLEPDGSFSPGLATEFGYTDDENKIYELTLREGVKFSDGAPLDAEAVKTYLEYLKKQSSSPGLLVQSIDSIEVLTENSLRISLNRSDPGLSFYFAQAFGAGDIASPKAVAKPASLNTGTAGAGPYMIDPEQTVANERYTYVPNPHYYDPEAVHYDKVVVQIVANASSMVQAMRAGEIQAAQGDATTLEAAAGAGLEVVSAPQALTGLNLMDRDGKASKALADSQVRRALNLAVDREAIAKGLYGDADLALSQYALPGTPGYDAALDDEVAYDPAEAKRLLAAAGYPDGFTISAVTAPLAGLDKMTQAIAGDLAEVGVTLEVTSKPTANDYFTAMTSGDHPTAALGYGLYNANSLYGGFVAEQGPFNPFHHKDGQLDKLYAEYFATPTDQADALEKKINARLVDQGWSIPVVGAPLAWYVADGYAGLEATTQNAAVPRLTELHPEG
ncbi:ABC transporter substrate-binding protein [Nocardioides sp. NPDC058538]|uniref:ABC transporter substrate-binding protein n=1 Tax=Nocardioides sp. NPDC058538 TaxID=3346542 RepID=UPI003651B52E